MCCLLFHLLKDYNIHYEYLKVIYQGTIIVMGIPLFPVTMHL